MISSVKCRPRNSAARLQTIELHPNRSSAPICNTALFEINGSFFGIYLGVQGALSFILTAFIGPGLVSPDLANGALTLYLCRPLSRTEYVLGKMSVLAIQLSWITWIPGLLLFFVQAGLSGPHWLIVNAWVASRPLL